jgi:hypothetical protein
MIATTATIAITMKIVRDGRVCPGARRRRFERVNGCRRRGMMVYTWVMWRRRDCGERVGKRDG